MLQEKLSHIETFRVITQMLASIREINRRMDELKWVVKEGFCSEKGRKEIVKRLERMNETKMCIIYSVSDLRIRANEALGKAEAISVSSIYQELKNL